MCVCSCDVSLMCYITWGGFSLPLSLSLSNVLLELFRFYMYATHYHHINFLFLSFLYIFYFYPPLSLYIITNLFFLSSFFKTINLIYLPITLLFILGTTTHLFIRTYWNHYAMTSINFSYVSLLPSDGLICTKKWFKLIDWVILQFLNHQYLINCNLTRPL